MAEVLLRFLNRAAVERLGGLDVDLAVEDVRETLRLLAAGEAAMPAEVPIRLAAGGGAPGDAAVYALPALVGGRFGMVGVKWTAHRAATTGDAAPRILSVTLLNDAATGRPVALVESALLTAMRTAAVSWLAIEHLGRVGARRVAVLGAGVQARTHLRMLAARMPRLAEVAVFNRTAARAHALAEGLAGRVPWPIRVATSVEEAVAGTDVLLACTAAEAPLVDRPHVGPHLLAVQVGFDEFTFDAIDAFDHVVVDAWGEFRLTSQKSLFRMHRAGRFPPERVSADLADLVCRGRSLPPDRSVYVSSFGLNVFDIALAARLARKAERANDGTLLPLGGLPGGGWA